MVSCFVKKRSFFLGALLITMFSTTRQHCMSPHAIADGLKTVGSEITTDIKTDLLSPYLDFFDTIINIFSNEKTNDDGKISLCKFLALSLKVFLTTNRILATAEYIGTLLPNKISITDTLPSAAQYQGPHNNLILAMARRMQLNPAYIHIFHSNHHAASYYPFKQYLLEIPKPIANQVYLTLPLGYELIHTYPYSIGFIGHEFVHIAHKDSLKRILWTIIAPWAIKATLITANTLTRLAAKTIKNHFHIVPESKADKIITGTSNSLHILLRNPVLEALYNNRLRTHYFRAQEKQADLASAHIFTCAKELALDLQAHAQKMNLLRKLDKKFLEFYDEHPTSEERINYLLPIAQKQGYRESITKIIPNPNQKPLSYIHLKQKLAMILDMVIIDLF
jgi:Zn-dependent protease with chaperone function